MTQTEHRDPFTPQQRQMLDMIGDMETGDLRAALCYLIGASPDRVSEAFDLALPSVGGEA